MDTGVDTAAAGTTSPATHRILTIPNLFTLLRLACLPLFLYLLLARDNPAAAAWLLLALGATDWVDGYLARRLGQVSEFGKVFDPTVDRVLFIVALIGIIVDGAAPAWFCWAIIIREVFVAAMMAIGTVVFHMVRFDVSWWGKLATFLLMGAVPAFVLGSSDFPGHALFQLIGWGVGIPGLVLSWVTAVAYVPRVRAAIAAGRNSK